MLPGRAALPETLQPVQGPSGSVQPVSNPYGVQPVSPNPVAANTSQPASNGTSSGGLRTVVRDLNGNPAGSPLSTLPASRTGIAGAPNAAQPISQGLAQRALQPTQSASGSIQPAQPSGGLAGRLGQSAAAYNSSPAPAQYAASQTPVSTDPANPDPNASLRPGGTNPGVMPVLGPSNTQVNPPSQLDRDQSRLNYLTNSGSGVSQIKNPWVRGAARIGDIGLSLIAPGAAALAPGTSFHHQVLVGQQQGIVGNDEAQQQAAAQLENTQQQAQLRAAQGRQFDAKANYYDPQPLDAPTAKAMGHPEWAGMPMDTRDAERLISSNAHNQTTLQTHYGGQQRKLSADDAAAIGTPSLEGANVSNDEYQRLLQGAQHNQQWDTNNQRSTDQSDANNRRNNSTRITTTGMRDDTSAANSDRSHPGGGAPKPIPAGVRDRIESQKQTALNKARASFDNGESSMDDYLDAWQQGQNDYEERIQAQTGQPVQHLDIRSNVDGKGNWVGNRSQPATSQPQAQTGRPAAFVTQKGNRVAIGDPVNVGGRSGTVTGFNSRTGKAQVSWVGSK
jgi:hypothetical protein